MCARPISRSPSSFQPEGAAAHILNVASIPLASRPGPGWRSTPQSLYLLPAGTIRLAPRGAGDGVVPGAGATEFQARAGTGGDFSAAADAPPPGGGGWAIAASGGRRVVIPEAPAIGDDARGFVPHSILLKIRTSPRRAGLDQAYRAGFMARARMSLKSSVAQAIESTCPLDIPRHAPADLIVMHQGHRPGRVGQACTSAAIPRHAPAAARDRCRRPWPGTPPPSASAAP